MKIDFDSSLTCYNLDPKSNSVITFLTFFKFNEFWENYSKNFQILFKFFWFMQKLLETIEHKVYECILKRNRKIQIFVLHNVFIGNFSNSLVFQFEQMIKMKSFKKKNKIEKKQQLWILWTNTWACWSSWALNLMILFLEHMEACVIWTDSGVVLFFQGTLYSTKQTKVVFIL